MEDKSIMCGIFQDDTKYSKANPYLPYLQVMSDDKMSIFTALLSDTVNYGLFHRVVLDFCIYGPWHNKHGEMQAEDISKLWDEEHNKYPNSTNLDIVKNNFMELVDEYATRIARAYTKYMDKKQAQSEGGKKTQRNRQHKSTASQDPEGDDKSDAIPEDVPKLKGYQDMYLDFARNGGLTLDQAKQFMDDVLKNREQSTFFTEQNRGKVPANIAMLRAIISPQEENIKSFLRSVCYKEINGVTIVSQLEQKWVLLYWCCSLDWKKPFSEMFKEYNGFRFSTGHSGILYLSMNANNPDHFCELANRFVKNDDGTIV